jgi:hypothetical protein
MCDDLKERCSDYILDLLEYIQTRLLRVDPVNRAKIVEIVRKLENIDDACQRDVDYCISRTPERSPIRINTDPEYLSVPGLPIEDLVADKDSILDANIVEAIPPKAQVSDEISTEEAGADLEARRYHSENITNDTLGPQDESPKTHMTSIDRLREKFREYKRNMHRCGLKTVNLCCGEN